MSLTRNTVLAFLILAVSAHFVRAQVDPAAQKTLKVGFTNIELLIAYMPDSKNIEKEVQTLENKLIQSLEIKQKNYQLELDEYIQKVEGNLIPPDQQKAEEERLYGLKSEIEKDIQAADEQVYNRRMQLLMPLQEKIQVAIDAVAKEGGYSYILNQVVGSGVPTIIFGAENMDVTDDIAKKLGIVVPEAPATPEK